MVGIILQRVFWKGKEAQKAMKKNAKLNFRESQFHCRTKEKKRDLSREFFLYCVENALGMILDRFPFFKRKMWMPVFALKHIAENIF